MQKETVMRTVSSDKKNTTNNTKLKCKIKLQKYQNQKKNCQKLQQLRCISPCKHQLWEWCPESQGCAVGNKKLYSLMAGSAGGPTCSFYFGGGGSSAQWYGQNDNYLLSAEPMGFSPEGHFRPPLTTFLGAFRKF